MQCQLVSANSAAVPQRTQRSKALHRRVRRERRTDDAENNLQTAVAAIFSHRRINPQYLDEIRYLAEVTQGIARRFVIAAQEIDIENIFPGPAAHGPRFDLAEADVAQRKHAQRLEQ